MKSMSLFLAATALASCTSAEGKNVDISNSYLSPAPSMPSIEFYEEFRESGEWMARFDYRTSETLIGTWKKRGNEICVIITDADVKSRVTGKEVCRSFYERDGVLSIRDVRDQKRELFVEINKLGDK